MKKLSIILFLFIAGISVTFGQTVSDSIQTKKVSGGYQFYQNGKIMTMQQLTTTIKPNQEAFKMYSSAQANNTFSSILGGVGGGLVGWTLGTALGGGDANWTMALIGAGLIVVAIPISINSVKQYKSAVEIYNRGLKSTSFLDKAELNLCFTGNGVGFVMRF